MKIELANFRSLSPASEISIKPLTILVGRNSSGKSTFARFLPLLRQSIEARSRVPILWFGEYVDFGTISEVATKLTTQKPQFSIEFSPTTLFRRRATRRGHPRKREHISQIRFRMTLCDKDGETRISGFSVCLNNVDTLDVTINENNNIQQLVANGIDMTEYIHAETSIDVTKIVPLITAPHIRVPDLQAPFENKYTEKITYEIRETLKKRLHGQFKNVTLNELARKIKYVDQIHFINELSDRGKDYESWKEMVRNFQNGQDQVAFQTLHALSLIREIPDILIGIEDEISRTFSNVGYIAPSRSTGYRYHRIRELQVEELDPYGENLAMFLQSLSENDKENFSEWARQHLGYAVHPRIIPGHVSVMLREDASTHEYNITDMGFGLSQVLPVAVQLWAYKERARRRPRDHFLVVEQPELHLHPAYQGNLANLLVGAYSLANSRAGAGSLSLVVETHSQDLIAKLGGLVRNGTINHDDIGIYVFDKPGPDEPTEVFSSGFDEDGDLQNWPFGFFSAW